MLSKQVGKISQQAAAVSDLEAGCHPRLVRGRGIEIRCGLVWLEDGKLIVASGNRDEAPCGVAGRYLVYSGLWDNCSNLVVKFV